MGNEYSNLIPKEKSMIYKWYFRADENPYDETAIAKWSPYGILDNYKIENEYLKFSLSKGNYDEKVLIDDYEINFRTKIQYNLNII